MSVSEYAQYQNPGTSTAKWNAAIINVIYSTCAMKQGLLFMLTGMAWFTLTLE